MLVEEPIDTYRVEDSTGRRGTCYVYVDGFEVHFDKLIVVNMSEGIEDYGLRKIC